MSFKVLLAGCGKIAWRGHGPALAHYVQAHPEVQLAACVDPDGEKAAAFAERFGFQSWYTNLDDALEQVQPHAVSLVVPAEVIAGLAVRILHRGYPLLLEKPPGLSRAEAEQIREAARRPGGAVIPTQVAFNRRLMPISCAVREQASSWIQEGKLHHISYEIHRVGRTDAEDASVTLIHGIDVLRSWTGSDYRRIGFRYRPLEHLGARVTNVSLDGELDCGVTFSLHYYPVSGEVSERASLLAEQATMEVRLPFWTSSDSPGRMSLYTNNQLIRHQAFETGLPPAEDFMSNGFYAQQATFLDHLRAGSAPEHDIASAIQSVVVAEHVLHRAETYVAARACTSTQTSTEE